MCTVVKVNLRVKVLLTECVDLDLAQLFDGGNEVLTGRRGIILDSKVAYDEGIAKDGAEGMFCIMAEQAVDDWVLLVAVLRQMDNETVLQEQTSLGQPVHALVDPK
jgi:hypothetical protein